MVDRVQIDGRKGSREVPRGMAWLKKASWRKEYWKWVLKDM